MTHKNLQAAQNLLMPYLEEARRKQNVEDLYMMLTEVPRKDERGDLHRPPRPRDAAGRL